MKLLAKNQLIGTHGGFAVFRDLFEKPDGERISCRKSGSGQGGGPAMKPLLLTCLLAVTASALLAGCSTLDPAAHNAKVAALRNRTPYLTRIGLTHSMSTVVVAGSTRMVSPLAHNRLQSGMAAVYWPIGSPNPVCHFVGRRIGTDSWETHGMNQPGDIGALGYLLTRENYIGVIR